MNWTLTLKEFIREHAGEDVNRLLLAASRYPEIDMAFAVEQIAARKQIQEKLPSWHANDELIFPSRLAAEQCSSELTARYKQRLVSESMHLCDLTGGLGIDTLFFSRKVKQVSYLERFQAYCEAARHNFKSLGATNINVLEGDALEVLPTLSGIDAFYIDPARRGDGNKRVYALQDCEPDLVKLLPELLRQAPLVIAKISPMADIRQTLELLPGVTEIHVLSVKNECKEILFVIREKAAISDPHIYCINLVGNREETFDFTLSEEENTLPGFTHTTQKYLYEPNASVLKAGAFKCITRLGVTKLHINSHLYTSGQLLEDFPGRRFVIEEILPFNNKCCKTIRTKIPKANISTRNFPLSVDALRKRSGIQEGGDIYLFATTLANQEKVLISSRKASGEEQNH
ncbi:hypothetical protein M2459_001749 [Parabacteroides sp. PF5-5]|uniref:class I SAM-dependent methyltransferase n=1 Tax=unclassified Parabacteroides TaxID=2649774 RepID=UPI00247474CE|nr:MULTISPECIES: SAM-dependent methyltransferase [unclassified Parabacteroides]MDH6305012.1 hypothetical protein [Parabacteroides sp. PH5-39]MDH6315903.1 hypothetical protein [Parabacteroides sp. PF5-13]MDH6319560.1 hypothetical protein [Parabacteroides sp. PH5-13]MDH6323291.1 hypothetical protein [Parabacteroides sp. PH5-8]MDH6327201.1 hypothetical protein [Parabacteroides sp. PH5-41]